MVEVDLHEQENNEELVRKKELVDTLAYVALGVSTAGVAVALANFRYVEVTYPERFHNFHTRYLCFKTNEKLYESGDLLIKGKAIDEPSFMSKLSSVQKLNEEFLYKKHKTAFLTPDKIDKTPFVKLNDCFSLAFRGEYNYRNLTPQQIANQWQNSVVALNTKTIIDHGVAVVGGEYIEIIHPAVRNMRTPSSKIKAFTIYHPYITELGNNQPFEDISYQNIRYKDRVQFLDDASQHLQKTKFANKFPLDQQAAAQNKIDGIYKQYQWVYRNRNFGLYVLNKFIHPIDETIIPASNFIKSIPGSVKNGVEKHFSQKKRAAYKHRLREYKRNFVLRVDQLQVRLATYKFNTVEYLQNKTRFSYLYNKSVPLSYNMQSLAIGNVGQIVTCAVVLNNGIHSFSSERKASLLIDIKAFNNAEEAYFYDPILYASLNMRYQFMNATEKVSSLVNLTVGVCFVAAESFKKAYADPFNRAMSKRMKSIGICHKNGAKTGKAIREFVIIFADHFGEIKYQYTIKFNSFMRKARRTVVGAVENRMKKKRPIGQKSRAIALNNHFYADQWRTSHEMNNNLAVSGLPENEREKPESLNVALRSFDVFNVHKEEDVIKPKTQVPAKSKEQSLSMGNIPLNIIFVYK